MKSPSTGTPTKQIQKSLLNFFSTPQPKDLEKCANDKSLANKELENSPFLNGSEEIQREVVYNEDTKNDVFSINSVQKGALSNDSVQREIFSSPSVSKKLRIMDDDDLLETPKSKKIDAGHVRKLSSHFSNDKSPITTAA